MATSWQDVFAATSAVAAAMVAGFFGWLYLTGFLSFPVAAALAGLNVVVGLYSLRLALSDSSTED